MSAVAKMRFVLNRKGVRQLLRSDEMMSVVQSHAYETQAALGDGYVVTYRTGKNRVNASVAAMSPEARQENLKHNTILKALK